MQGCEAMCSGHAPELEAPESFVGRWMDLLRPKYETVEKVEDPAEQQLLLERQAVMTSLENLMTFPWIKEKVEDGTLSLHGLWTDIGEGSLEYYDAKAHKFEPV